MASSSEQNSEYCISVYVDETKLTPRVKAKIIKILTELFIKQIPTEFVTVHKISKHDRGLAKRIALELGTTGKEVDWPVVYINGSPVGSFETLKVWLARKENVASLSDELYFSTEGSVEKLMESLIKEYEELQHEYTRAKQLGRVNEAKDLEFSIKEIEQCLSRMKEASGGEFVDDDFAEAQFDQQPPAYSFPRDLTASSPGLDMRLSELRNVHINSPKQTERKHKQEEEKPLPRSRPVEVQQPIPIQGNEESLELGYVGKTMETIEWAIQNVSSAVGSTFSYYWGTDVEEKKYIDDDANNKGEEHLIGQFSVIQTNWYWRQQNRVLQFYERKFRRLNPLHSSPVRAVHNYEDIQNIVVDGTNFTITYHDASAEYYQSSHASTIADLINRKRQLHR